MALPVMSLARTLRVQVGGPARDQPCRCRKTDSLKAAVFEVPSVMSLIA